MSRETTPQRPRHDDGFAWGYNNSGALGVAGTARVLRPTAVTLPPGTVDVQGGSDFTVALTDAGDVYTWGGNRWGQLGDSTTRTHLQPHRVALPVGQTIIKVAAGQDHVLALTRQGGVFAWGRNHHGQLGDGTLDDRRSPVAATLPHGHVASQIAAGNASSYTVSARGEVSAWGHAAPLGTAARSDALTQTNIGVTNALTAQQLTLPAGVKAATVDAGERHLVVLTGEGKVLTYGRSLGGHPMTTATLPMAASLGTVTAISAGDRHTVALTDTGKVLVWGANDVGQLAHPKAVSAEAPHAVHIPRLRGRVVRIAAGANSVITQTDANAVYSWGHGQFGQQGIGSTANALRPARVDLPDNTVVTGVHAARFHCFVTTR